MTGFAKLSWFQFPIIPLIFFMLNMGNMAMLGQEQEEDIPRARARDLGIAFGILHPGPLNGITDVPGVRVGHVTVISGESTRTGVTVILPHEKNPFQIRVPAAVFVGNGFGKAVGFTQVQELGELETPIALTNTLGIHRVADALAEYVLELPGNEKVVSVNPVVGETNDGYLNEVRKKVIGKAEVLEAIRTASSGPVPEGNVGAGTATRAFGFKGGIGTSSRRLPKKLGGYTVGVLVQSNFGGVLSINGAPVGKELKNHYLAGQNLDPGDGSIMIIVATDAPLDARNLHRICKRAFMGIARTGGFASNGSGDYAIAFSVNPSTMRDIQSGSKTTEIAPLRNEAMDPLFLAAVEATEEAIIDSMFMAEPMKGWQGREVKALPIRKTLEIMKRHGMLHE